MKNNYLIAVLLFISIVGYTQNDPNREILVYFSEGITQETRTEIEQPKPKALQTISKNTSKQINKDLFTIPSAGNSITQGDVDKNQIRITVDFKEFFPAKSSEILIEYKKEIFNVIFSYRFNKSHILRLGNNLATRIKLKAGMSVNMTVIDKNKFRIE